MESQFLEAPTEMKIGSKNLGLQNVIGGIEFIMQNSSSASNFPWKTLVFETPKLFIISENPQIKGMDIFCNRTFFCHGQVVMNFY